MKTNMSGNRFGRLVVLKQVGVDNHRNRVWACLCDCGGTTEQRTNTLKMGLVRSCGCLQRETQREKMLNEKNPNWSSGTPSLGAVHTWVRERKPRPEYCERCRKEVPHDLANISGKYLRDVSDYEWLCRKCHMTDDGRINRRKENGQFERSGVYKCGVNQSLQ
jgi:hypothetical protein